ncbi:nucleotidyltransferase [Clostridioides mangenotii]|uniref:nucleotidyltransferase n=1 Tax=Metaclostridioides mangenotii TaxID=1540 RepID=UPI001C10876E|nr:nucleotidyltransferase [Clostridioides mangenotii]MBU5306660.1 nucleotidyltransferase [Clostridioides mangenotii]
MNILGLVVEYNPFHNGHLFHLNESKKKTEASHTVAVMSGNFLQRGEPAILDKHTRAEMAVRAGVDLVIELPTLYACQSAELFSYGAITTLNSLNCINSICFGSEVGDIRLLYAISDILSCEPLEFKASLKTYLDLGMLFPTARSKALIEYISKHNINSTNNNYSLVNIEEVLNNPNNILGIEYIKRLIKLNSSIKPYTIKRIQSEYNSTVMTGFISSATAIRNKLNACENLEEIENAMPLTSYQVLKNKIDENNLLMHDELFFDTLKATIFRDKERLTDIFEVNEGIENKIYKEAFIAKNANELVNLVKSKRYTMTKVKRILNNILLGISKDEINKAKEVETMPYVRILAFNNKGREILKEIKNNSEIKIINKFSNIEFYLDDPNFKNLIQNDIRATNIYNTVYLKGRKIKFKGPNDFYAKPFYLDE